VPKTDISKLQEPKVDPYLQQAEKGKIIDQTNQLPAWLARALKQL
jgi:hypothetical protein